MSLECKYCKSTNLKIHDHKRKEGVIVSTRYKCKDCKSSFAVAVADTTYNIKKAVKKSTYVITSCQNDTSINRDFYESLKTYCEHNNAKLLVLKTQMLTSHNQMFPPVWGADTEDIVEGNISISDKILILNQFRISVSVANPLAGLDDISKGKHLILGHNQLQMRTLPSNSPKNPIFAHTTGTISYPNYTITKAGYKAEEHHSFSAICVEIGEDDYINFRVLCADDEGCFYDVNGYYTPTEWRPLESVEALITGDEHAVFIDPDVLQNTYTNKDSMTSVLKPKVIVRHDVLDFYSGSHHHESNYLLKYKKVASDQNSVEEELVRTVDHIVSTTPEDATCYIISSNHNDHLTKWLNSVDPKSDLRNAKLYHWFMYNLMSYIDDTGIMMDPLELWVRSRYFHADTNIEFIGRQDELCIKDIVISEHGDNGLNGSRGSPAQFAKFSKKHIIGHSHSPKIEKGCYQVGTSTDRLEYAKGKTTWANTHCVIYPNGTRQLLHIIKNKWKNH